MMYGGQTDKYDYHKVRVYIEHKSTTVSYFTSTLLCLQVGFDDVILPSILQQVWISLSFLFS